MWKRPQLWRCWGLTAAEKEWKHSTEDRDSTCLLNICIIWDKFNHYSFDCRNKTQHWLSCWLWLCLGMVSGRGWLSYQIILTAKLSPVYPLYPLAIEIPGNNSVDTGMVRRGQNAVSVYLPDTALQMHLGDMLTTSSWNCGITSPEVQMWTSPL